MDPHPPAPSFWKSPFGVLATVAALAASAYFYLVHRNHVLALLPYAFLAACPLMHVFMHRGHGHGGHARSSEHKGHGEGPG